MSSKYLLTRKRHKLAPSLCVVTITNYVDMSIIHAFGPNTRKFVSSVDHISLLVASAKQMLNSSLHASTTTSQRCHIPIEIVESHIV